MVSLQALFSITTHPLNITLTVFSHESKLRGALSSDISIKIDTGFFHYGRFYNNLKEAFEDSGPGQ